MILPILEQILMFLPLIIGAYISMSLMKITNFSIESAYLFGAIVAGQALQNGYSGPLALFIALISSACAGALVGVFTALLFEKAKFSDVLSAIITVGFFYGLAQMVMAGSHITLSGLYNPLKMYVYFEKYPHLITMLCVSLTLYLLFMIFVKTQLGMSCAIYGNNKLFLQNYRMNQSYVVISGLAISNGLAGISGYMVSQSNGFVDLYMGMGLPLLCLSSLILGKSMRGVFRPIQPSVPILGTTAYFVVQSVLLKIGFDLRYFTAVQAVIVAAMLVFTSRFFKSSRQDLLGI